jgi:hypothetical protein
MSHRLIPPELAKVIRIHQISDSEQVSLPRGKTGMDDALRSRERISPKGAWRENLLVDLHTERPIIQFEKCVSVADLLLCTARQLCKAVQPERDVGM